MKSTPLTIGEVAAHFGLPTHVLRHWESEGLLSPTRAVAARRHYTSDDLYRIAAILKAKEAGMSLPDIREMLTAPTGTARKEVLRRHHAELRARIARAQDAMKLMEGGLNCTHEDITTCPNYQRILREIVEER